MPAKPCHRVPYLHIFLSSSPKLDLALQICLTRAEQRGSIYFFNLLTILSQKQAGVLLMVYA